MATRGSNPDQHEATSEAPGGAAMSARKLRDLASQLTGESSVLDGIQEPIDLEDVRRKIFSDALPDLANLANYLGYGWVSGSDGRYVGEDYVWVPTGQTGADSSWHKAAGPAFAPSYGRRADGFMADKRCSIEFTDVRLVYTTPKLDRASLRWDDNPVAISVGDFEIDNGAGETPTVTQFDVEYFQQGDVGAATQRTWEDGWNFSVSSTQTFNEGEPESFYPAFTISLTEEAGMSGSVGGSDSTTTSLSKGSRTTASFTHSTAAWTRGVYQVRTQEGTGTAAFSCTATLEYSVRFYGFLRWGGGHRYEGDTNYSIDHSGSDDRPVFDFTLGDARTPWWKALSVALESDHGSGSGKWAWKKMSDHYGIDGFLRGLATRGAARSSFPIKGVLGGVRRSKAKWVTVSEDPAA